MKLNHLRALVAVGISATVVVLIFALASCSSAPKLADDGSGAVGGKPKAATAEVDQAHQIGGEGVIELNRVATQSAKPEFTHAALLPGRGMNTFQLSAFVPGRGTVQVLNSIPLDEAVKLFSSEDPYGNLSVKYGGAILLPFANRIRGKLSKDGKFITTDISGHKAKLPANWEGKNKGAEKHAIHGLILNQAVQVHEMHAAGGDASAEGLLNAGNFADHWPASFQIRFHTELKGDAFVLEVDAKNVGKEAGPIGIGWHPYFAIPSGQRAQAKLVLPGTQRALVNNYDDVFPTGKVEAVKGTRYDFTAPQGTALGQQFLDDCFIGFDRQEGAPVIAELIDPAAHYGLRIRAFSPEIKAFQVYAPTEQNFVAFEPQFNLGDPTSRVWKKHHIDSGMVMVKPGESVKYRVQLELFVP